MSIRCKICNAPKMTNIIQINSDINWECQSCGNLLDAHGFIVTSD